MSGLQIPLHIIFYIFATIAVCSATAVITVKNPVRSVLSLVITFFAMAAIWMMMQAEFLSLILILVYVGAVMTLFLFVVMMLNIDKEDKRSGFVAYWPFGVIIILLLVSLLLIAVKPSYVSLLAIEKPIISSVNDSNIQQLGSILYTEFAYPFEIAGVLLLTAIIAAITLAHRSPRRRLVQNPADQLAVRSQDRVRLVKLFPQSSISKEQGES